MKKREPVMMIGLDGTEITLIQDLMNTNRMPALKRLRDAGCFGVVEGDAEVFAGGVWPSFYTARPVPWHGIYHNKLWRYDHMRCEMASDAWLPEKPFWEELGGEDLKMAVIDVPMTLGRPMPLNGLHINGWGTHDLISRGAWPEGLWASLRRQYGPPLFPAEAFGPQNGRTLCRLKSDLIKATRQVIDIAEDQARRDVWDLFLIVLGAGHRAGHYLWDSSQVDVDRMPTHRRQEIETALIDIYREMDEGVARLVRSALSGTRFMVFSVHGMGRNQGWSDFCGRILSLIQGAEDPRTSGTGMLYRLKQILPWPVIRQVTRRLPQFVLDRLVELWSADMFDWSTTEFFPLPMDHAGYIRINLKGREPKGIVEPGKPYDQLCSRIAESLLGFKDLDTGLPVVDRIYSLGELAPHDADYRQGLPDLVVTWSERSAIDSGGIESPRYGKLLLDGKLPSGRCGNHRSKGWFVAAGPGIPESGVANSCSVIDLVPSIFSWLGVKAPKTFMGRPIPMISARG